MTLTIPQFDSVVTAGLLIAAACEGNKIGKIVLYALAAISMFL